MPSKIGHPKKKQYPDASFLFPVMLICVTDSSFEMPLAYFGQFYQFRTGLFRKEKIASNSKLDALKI
ncbi:hypothetical protein B0E44_15365 [Flavobacterium sp. A45]|nr:hypothetical protein B0E44_15365 [Flavobacterium sp. A45]